MRMFPESRTAFCFLVALFWLSLPSLTGLVAQEDAPIPAFRAWAIDTTGTLSQDEIQQLHNKLEAFQKENGSQIAVLIVPTTQPETIEQYCLRVAEKWKVGQKGADNGVILCVAKKDRRLRIEVGYGAEGVIPDARAKQIIEDIIVPYFKKGEFFAGIDAGTNAIMQLLKGEDFGAVVNKNASESEVVSSEDDEAGFYGFVILFSIIAFVLHIVVPNRYLFGVGAIGSGGSFLFSLIVLDFFQALLVGGAFFLVTMFGMQILWAFLSSGGRSGGSYSGGGSSFSGGGGGSFGGGGASGSW